MKKILLFFMSLILLMPEMSAESIYMKIGETKKLSPSVLTTKVLAGQPSWTSSRPYDVKIVSYDMYSCTIEAKNSFSGFATIHCLYYFRELDPATGRYLYQRSGYVDYHVFVEDSTGGGNEGGNSGGSNNPDYGENKKIVLCNNSVTLKENETTEVRVQSANAKSVSWRIQDSSIAKITQINDGWTLQVKGVREGSTVLYASDAGGGTATCKVSVSKRYFTNGESINRIPSEEGVMLGFEVTDANRNECKLAFIDNPSDYNNITTITIPQSVYGLSVMSVGPSVFSSFATSEKCVNLSLPESVQEIEDYAFSDSPIKSISLPSNLKKIGVYAFGSSMVESIDIPEGVNYIGGRCFSRCENLKSVNFPSTLRIIPEECFKSCKSLTMIYMPIGIEEIHEFAFRGTMIYNFYLPRSVKILKNGCIGSPVHLICDSYNPCQVEGGVLSNTLRVIVPVGSRNIYMKSEYWSMTNIMDYDKNLTTVCLVQYSQYNNNVFIFGDSKGSTLGIFESRFDNVDKSDTYSVTFVDVDSFTEYGTKDKDPIFENVESWMVSNSKEYELYPLIDNEVQKFSMTDDWPGGDLKIKVDYHRKKVIFSINDNKGDSAIEEVNQHDNSIPVYYNIHGVRVENPNNGFFIRMVNGKSTKVLIK